MYIGRVLIKNYKSIQEIDLRFSKGKNIIVGQNNSGKSNIISAINLVLGEKYPPKTFEESYYHDSEKSFLVIVKMLECNIFDKSFLEGYNKKIGYYLVDNHSSFEKSSDEIEQTLSATWITSAELIEIIENADSTYISLYSKENEESIYAITIKRGEKYYRLKYVYKEMISSFITSSIIPSERSIKSELTISEYSWYGKLIKNVWKDKIGNYQEKIDDNNTNLSTITDEIFNDLTNELQNSVKDAICYNSLSFKLLQDTKNDYYKGVKILLDDGYYSLLEDKGSGIKSLIIIELFKLYCKKYHKASSCLIVEEPEIFLHPQARSVLSKKIDQFLDNDKNQTIITTHSEQFISNFDIRQLIFVNKENGCSKAYTISEGDFSPKELEKMNIICSTENAEMFFANQVILVEGGEKYILAKLIEVIKSPLLLNYNNVSIISVGGKSFFEVYKLMLEKLHKKVYILGDYDNLKDGLTQFVCNNIDLLNTVKSRNNGLIKYYDMSDLDKKDMDKVFDELKGKNIYILHKGELEDYYKLDKINKIKSEEKISGKEVVAHYISTTINKDNFGEYLDIENDFREYIDLIVDEITSANSFKQ